MRKMLITGGTVFVSRFAAEYFAGKYDVYVLNRNTRPQCAGVNLIEQDRHALGSCLKNYHFDVILDITAYDAQDVNDLLDAVGSFDDYILISSSAVYPETAPQPFTEETVVGPNGIWGKYGTDKIAAENALIQRCPRAYILRPPYLYGPGNNVYREAFVFECALAGRSFYLPGNGDMQLQFFHIKDLCRFIDCILEAHPKQRIFNVGNYETISIRHWVASCYMAAGKSPTFVHVDKEVDQRKYFPFYDYEYTLDVESQRALLPEVMHLDDGLKESLIWYQKNAALVNRKPLISYIDENQKKAHDRSAVFEARKIGANKGKNHEQF